MVNFTFYTPTKVVFGTDAASQVGTLALAEGAAKVLLHYGGQSAEKSGLLGKVRAALAGAGLPFTELGGVQPNPRLALVREGIALCRAEGINFILAVGGGSVIDSAKAIAYGVADAENGDVWDFYAGERVPSASLPVGAVPTIAAAGSEMSNSSVITNAQTGHKRGLSSEPWGRVRFAAMDPQWTLSLPAYQTAVGCADVLMHTIERYFTDVSPTLAITDALAEALMREVLSYARTLAREPQNEAARAGIFWAGSLSHNGLTGCGNGGGDWACHQLGHELSAKYELAHGASLTVVFGAWARYVYTCCPARFARFAVNVLGLEESGSDEATALAGIEELEGIFWALELPTNMEEAGIAASDADIEDMAVRCSHTHKRTIGAVKKLNAEDMRAIYTRARRGTV